MPRPRKNDAKLYDLLMKACPPDKTGNVSPKILAAAIGRSHQCVYGWITRNKIPAARVVEIIEACGRKKRIRNKKKADGSAVYRILSEKQFSPFVFRA